MREYLFLVNCNWLFMRPYWYLDFSWLMFLTGSGNPSWQFDHINVTLLNGRDFSPLWLFSALSLKFLNLTNSTFKFNLSSQHLWNTMYVYIIYVLCICDIMEWNLGWYISVKLHCTVLSLTVRPEGREWKVKVEAKYTPNMYTHTFRNTHAHKFRYIHRHTHIHTFWNTHTHKHTFRNTNTFRNMLTKKKWYFVYHQSPGVGP